MADRETVTEAAATEGATFAHERFRTELEVATKESPMDYVTEADRGAQRRVIERIREEFPDDPIVGEEDDELKRVPERGDYWVVDPIDGTTNFVLGLPTWATSVAAVGSDDSVAAATVAPAVDDRFVATSAGVTCNGAPVSVSDRADVAEFTVAPILRYGQDRDDEFGTLLCELLRAFGDLRRFGSAQLTLGYVAGGMLDAAVGLQPRPNPWDTIAGVSMVEWAGGTVTDVHGDAWTPTSDGLVASNGDAHERVLDRLHDVISLG
jgi:myo-inositol-1(or 4)-monophosphatase